MESIFMVFCKPHCKNITIKIWRSRCKDNVLLPSAIIQGGQLHTLTALTLQKGPRDRLYSMEKRKLLTLPD
jgi:hypothetical protein